MADEVLKALFSPKLQAVSSAIAGVTALRDRPAVEHDENILAVHDQAERFV